MVNDPNEDEDRKSTDARRTSRDLLGNTEALHQGLRERKKALMRQLISDTATLMFLEHGFDQVRVSEVADACDVSEKTVYNYFPTKESLLLDREEGSAEKLRKALGPAGDPVSPVEAMVGILKSELEQFLTHLDADDPVTYPLIADFNDLIESTPSLRAARADMIDRLAQVAAESMAARAGVDPSDPEPQIAADALTSLWRVFYRAIEKYSNGDLQRDEIRESVLSDVRRAARLLDTGLWSFATVVQGANGREQFKAASDASIEARKQVLAAMKQARSAWRAMKNEMDGPGLRRFPDQRDAHMRGHQLTHSEAFEFRRQTREHSQQLREGVRQRSQEQKNEIRQRSQVLKQELKEEARQHGQEIKEAVKRARRPSR
jgi:AcrR family transcriptional regulator